MSTQQIALDVLVSLGLSLGEARTFLALSLVESSEASPLAEPAEVPQSKIYQYLSALETKFGIVEKVKVSGKPNRYHATNFEMAVEKLQNRLEKDIETAKKYVKEKRRKKDKTTDLDYLRVVQGGRSVDDRLRELILTTDADNFIVLGVEDTIAEVRKYFEKSKAELLTLADLFDTLPPFVLLLQESEFEEFIKEVRVLVLFEGVDFDKETAVSVSIIGYPRAEMEIDPLFIHIKHPVIRNFQIKMVLTIMKIVKNFNPMNRDFF